MLNYIKSECYRVVNNMWVYATAGVLSILVLLLNLILYLFLNNTIDFPYGTTSYSFSNIVAQPMVYCYMAFIIAAILYEGEKRYGSKKNSIAYGISRTKIFAGKCIVSLFTSLAILFVVMAVYIVSAIVLLERKGPVEVSDMLMEVPAVSLIAVSALILGIVVLEYFDKSIAGMILWFFIFTAIPKSLFYIGIKVDSLMKIALWLPENFFTAEMTVNMSQCAAIWDTPAGMAKCLISGVAGIVIFSMAGVAILRKKEI
ncbi:MAG: ABC transporter permease [Lachnospiraceae bacterium]|nr:ABC transporter permease [Lachnospiraceae bacterium]